MSKAADLEALNDCLAQFIADMETLGAIACVASYVADDGDSWSGASDGFGVGPPLLQAGDAMMEHIMAHDAVAAAAIAAPFARAKI